MSNPNEQPQTSAPVWDPPDEFTANVRNHHLDMVAQTGWKLWDELKPGAKQVWRETVAFASAPYRNELRDLKAAGVQLLAEGETIKKTIDHLLGEVDGQSPVQAVIEAHAARNKAEAKVKLLTGQLAITEASRNEWQVKAERYGKEVYALTRRYRRLERRHRGRAKDIEEAFDALQRAGYSYNPKAKIPWKPPVNEAAQKLNALDCHSIEKMAAAAEKHTGSGMTSDWWRNAVASIRAWAMNERPLTTWGCQEDGWDDEWDDDDEPQVDPLDGLRNSAMGKASVIIENHLEIAIARISGKVSDIVRETVAEMTLAPYKAEQKPQEAVRCLRCGYTMGTFTGRPCPSAPPGDKAISCRAEKKPT